MSLLSQLSQREDAGIATCASCPRLCRHACPVAEAQARETSSPWNLVVTSGLLKRGRIEAESVGALPWSCSSCGACTEACLHKNDVSLWVMLARSRVLAGHAAPSVVEEVRGHFAIAGNPTGVPLEPVLEQVVAAAYSSVSPRAGHDVYFPGCTTLSERPEAAQSFLETVLVRGIQEIQITEASSACCGLPLLWAGDLEGFVAHAKRVAQRLSSSKRLVVHDPACAETFARRYAEFGVTLEPEVISVVELLAEHFGVSESAPIEAGAAHRRDDRASEAPKLAYLDTCATARRLGRSGLVSTPRKILALATGSIPAAVPGLSGSSVDCCGASGLLPLVASSTALAMAEARVAAFRESGAQRLVVASPRCAAHLARADASIIVRDLTSELAKLL
ncbi:MAG: (Fe-S)-binding protein [Deltaproteobacteria bacterium]|nr:(Fe-S)-binding protein [Deltaproteobacteria bacterium]